MSRVSVIGGGAWGTALAEVAARAGHGVDLIVRSPEAARAINEGHVNAGHLPGDRLSENVSARADGDALPDADIVLLVVPAQVSRQVLTAIGPDALAGKPVVLCARASSSKPSTARARSSLRPRPVPCRLSCPDRALPMTSPPAGRPR